MTRYRDYTIWDSEQREAEPANPFDDPEVQRRIAEIISRAATARRNSAPSQKRNQRTDVLSAPADAHSRRTDAWAPQVNGVVRTLMMLAEAAEPLGAKVVFLTPGKVSLHPPADFSRYPVGFGERAQGFAVHRLWHHD